MGIPIENYLGNTLSSTANEDQLMPGDQKNASFFQLKISRRPPEGNEERSKNSSPSFHGECKLNGSFSLNLKFWLECEKNN